MDYLDRKLFPDKVKLTESAAPRTTPFLGRSVHHIHASQVTTTLTGQAFIRDSITGETHVRPTSDIKSIGPAVKINRKLY